MTSVSVDFAARFREASRSLGLLKLAEAPAVEVDADSPYSGSGETVEVETTQGDEEDAVGIPAEHETPVNALNLFQHPDTHPILLDLVLLRKYGPEWFEWEPEILEIRIPLDFQGQHISEGNMHKVQAAKTLHYGERFWSDWEIFVWCCMAFNGVPPDFEVMQVPTVGQAMVAVDIAQRIREDVPWSEEMNDYLEQVHMFGGVLCPIAPLEWVTMDDLEEYPIDPDKVRELWPEVRKSGKAPREETVEAEQLSRLLDVQEYLEESRAALRAQLPITLHV